MGNINDEITSPTSNENTNNESSPITPKNETSNSSTDNTPGDNTPAEPEKYKIKIFQVDSSNLYITEEEFETIITDSNNNIIIQSTDNKLEIELAEGTYKLHQNAQHNKYILKDDFEFSVVKGSTKANIVLTTPNNYVKTDCCCLYIIHFIKPTLLINVKQDEDYKDQITLQVKSAENEKIIINEQNCHDCYTVLLNKGNYVVSSSITNTKYYKPVSEVRLFVNDWGEIFNASTNQPLFANKVTFDYQRILYTLSFDTYCDSDMVDYGITIEDMQNKHIDMIPSFKKVTLKASNYSITDANNSNLYIPFEPISLDLHNFKENHIVITLKATTDSNIIFSHVFKDLHGYHQAVKGCTDEIYEYLDKNSTKLVRQIVNGFDCEVTLEKNKQYKYTCKQQPANYSKPKSVIFKVLNDKSIRVLSEDGSFWNRTPNNKVVMCSQELDIKERPVTFSVIDSSNPKRQQINVRLSLYKKIKDVDTGTEEYEKIQEWLSGPEKSTFWLNTNESYMFYEDVPEHYECNKSYKVWFNVVDTGIQKNDDLTFTNHLELEIVNYKRPSVSIKCLDDKNLPLKYCHLYLLNKHGDIIDTWYTNETSHVIELYSNTDYILYESYSPQGYSINLPRIVNSEEKEIIVRHTYSKINTSNNNKPGDNTDDNEKDNSKPTKYKQYKRIIKGPIHVFKTPGFKHHIDDIDTAYAILEDEPYIDPVSNTLWRRIGYKIPGSGRIALGFILDVTEKPVPDDTLTRTFISDNY